MHQIKIKTERLSDGKLIGSGVKTMWRYYPLTKSCFPCSGEMHDTYAERTQNYLLHKSQELIEVGISVILDWGFWTKEKRDSVKAFYSVRS